MIHKVNIDIVCSILEHLDCCDRHALSQTCRKLKWTEDRKECKEHSAVANWCENHIAMIESAEETVVNGDDGTETGEDYEMSMRLKGNIYFAYTVRTQEDYLEIIWQHTRRNDFDCGYEHLHRYGQTYLGDRLMYIEKAWW